MPEVGEIRRAKEIGYKGSSKYIWLACETCGKERWVQFLKDKPDHLNCHICALRATETRVKIGAAHKGEGNFKWKGGKFKDSGGYIKIKLYPDDFFYPMVNLQGYVLEHRLVYAQHLGRCLQPFELVHHKNGIKDDNRLKNLQLVQEMQHAQITILEKRIAFLEKRVALLEAENILLKTSLDIIEIKEEGNGRKTEIKGY